MKRALGARASHSITNPETVIGRVNFNNHPRRAVAQWRGGLQPIADFFERASPSQSFCGVDYLAYLVWPRTRLLEQIHLRLLDFHLLGPDADDRMSRAHEHTSRRRRRTGNLLHLQPAILILCYLLHQKSATSVPGCLHLPTLDLRAIYASRGLFFRPLRPLSVQLQSPLQACAVWRLLSSTSATGRIVDLANSETPPGQAAP